MLSSFICAQNNTATKILFSTSSSHAPVEVMSSSVPLRQGEEQAACQTPEAL